MRIQCGGMAPAAPVNRPGKEGRMLQQAAQCVRQGKGHVRRSNQKPAAPALQQRQALPDGIEHLGAGVIRVVNQQNLRLACQMRLDLFCMPAGHNHHRPHTGGAHGVQQLVQKGAAAQRQQRLEPAHPGGKPGGGDQCTECHRLPSFARGGARPPIDSALILAQ